MPHDGLNLGQVSFSSSHTPTQRRPQSAPVRTGALNAAVGPMFELVAGQIERPLQARSSISTTLFSSVAHAGAFTVVFLLVSMSDRIVLPTPQETTHLVTLLAAMPPHQRGQNRHLSCSTLRLPTSHLCLRNCQKRRRPSRTSHRRPRSTSALAADSV